jgi:hypothetical protein
MRDPSDAAAEFEYRRTCRDDAVQELGFAARR